MSRATSVLLPIFATVLGAMSATTTAVLLDRWLRKRDERGDEPVRLDENAEPEGVAAVLSSLATKAGIGTSTGLATAAQEAPPNAPTMQQTKTATKTATKTKAITRSNAPALSAVAEPSIHPPTCKALSRIT